jgi:hypothetical protein
MVCFDARAQTQSSKANIQRFIGNAGTNLSKKNQPERNHCTELISQGSWLFGSRAVLVREFKSI